MLAGGFEAGVKLAELAVLEVMEAAFVAEDEPVQGYYLVYGVVFGWSERVLYR